LRSHNLAGKNKPLSTIPNKCNFKRKKLKEYVWNVITIYNVFSFGEQ